jgi:hypothetical protein
MFLHFDSIGNIVHGAKVECKFVLQLQSIIQPINGFFHEISEFVNTSEIGHA